MTLRADKLQSGRWVWLLIVGVLGWSTTMNPSQAADPERHTVVVLGDSIAAGYGLDPSEAYPALLQEKIDGEGWPWKVVNAGLSGDTSAGGLRRVDWILKQKVDVLVL